MNLKKLNDDLASGIDRLLISSDSWWNNIEKNYGTLIAVVGFTMVVVFSCIFFILAYKIG